MAKRILAVNVLKNRHLISGLIFGCDVLIYNSYRCNDTLFAYILKVKKPEIFFGHNYRISGTWHNLNACRSFLSEVNSKFTKLFTEDEITFKRVIRKEFYWVNFSLGGLKYLSEKVTSTGDTLASEDYFLKPGLIRKIRILAKFLYHIIRHGMEGKQLRTEQRNPEIPHHKESIGFLIKADFDISFLKNLILSYKENSVIIVYPAFIKKVKLAFPLARVVEIQPERPQKWRGNLFSIHPDYWEVVSMVNKCLPEIRALKTTLQSMNHSRMKALIMVEGENFPVYSICREVLKNSNVKVINTMNGMKAAEAHDADVDFDYWALWDQQMVDFFKLKCALPDTMLVNLGHLWKDEFFSMKFVNSCKLSEQQITHKKIVSVFLSGGRHGTKVEFLQEVFALLAECAVRNPELLFLVKEHPTYRIDGLKFKKYFSNPGFVFINNPDVEPDQLVFDTLHLSSFSITFGSTVALMSVWMETNCINYEENNDESMIYYNGDFFERVNKIEDLNKAISKNILINKDITKKTKPGQTVSENYRTFLNAL